MANTNVPSRDNWVFGNRKDSILKDKKALIDQYIKYMLIRTQTMFEYTNLPESLPARDLELMLQVNGFVVMKKVKGELYAFYGGLGGVPNAYYLPTLAVVANPYLKYSDSLEIDKECVVIRNDGLYMGLMPMFNKYAELLAECDISIRYGCVNSRILALIQADNDTANVSAKEFLKKIEDGTDLGIIATDGFFEGIKTLEYSASNTNITQIIELYNFLKANWYNEVGIKANYNMKREALNSNETDMDTKILLPLIDDMLNERKLGFEKVNKMIGTNIGVELASAWKQLRNEIKVTDVPEEVEEVTEDEETITND